MASDRTIVLGVTSDASLALMRGFPEYLRNAGWDVHVVSSEGPALQALRGVPGITAHSIAMVRQPSPIRDLRSLIAWVRLLRQIRPDLTSVGTPKAGLLGGLAARFVRVPRRIYLLRGLRLETASGVSRHILNQMEKLAMRSAHEVVAVSNSLMRRAIELSLINANRIRVLGAGSSNGIDLQKYSPELFDETDIVDLRQRLSVQPNVPVIGFVGRLTTDKGLSVLAEARAILTGDGIDHQLLIVGGIDDGEDDELMRSVRTSGRNAIEVGHINDPRRYYRLMDLLCLPTFREGFPNVVLEAAAMGLPTVTTDATGAIDSVIDGVTGRIAKVGDARSLATQLAAVLRAPVDERVAMGMAARQHVEENFSRDDVWRELGNFYQDGPATP